MIRFGDSTLVDLHSLWRAWGDQESVARSVCVCVCVCVHVRAHSFMACLPPRQATRELHVHDIEVGAEPTRFNGPILAKHV